MNITITMEGPPGAGKSALIALIVPLLDELGCRTILIGEPTPYDQDRASMVLSSVGPIVTIIESNR